jgi:peptidyl-prolyl cis-trans isomerase C
MKATGKLLAALLLAAAPAAAKITGGLAARVNNEPITEREYEKAKASLAEQYSSAMPDFFRQHDAASQLEKAALDKLVDEALLRQKAEALKLKVFERELENGVAEIRKRFSVSPEGAPLPTEKAEQAFRAELKKEGVTMEEFRERIRKQLLVQKVVQEQVKPRVKLPGDAEVKKYFENINLMLKGREAEVKGLPEDDMDDLKSVANRFRELTSERLRLRHVLVLVKEGASDADKAGAQKKAAGIRAELDAGLDFDEAVAKYSDDPESARNGGDLGYVVRGMLPEDLEKPAFELQVGGHSRPVQTKFGWHILRLEEKRAAQKLRFEAVRDDLEQLLSQASFASELASYLKELRNNAKIQDFREEKK